MTPPGTAGRAEVGLKGEEGVPFLSNTSLPERPAFSPQGSCEEVMGTGMGS